MRLLPKQIKLNQTWLLTFGDMVTLLICFFIMMIAINKGEVGKVHQWIELQLSDSRVFFQNQLANDMTDGGITITQDNQGILIQIQTSDAFEIAKAEPLPAFVNKLEVVGRVMKSAPIFQVAAQYPELIQLASTAGLSWMVEVNIEGHTDSDPMQATARYRSNWELSAMRAQRVMQLLQASSGLPEDIFTIAGRGEFLPLVANDSTEHKAMNRRIEIRLNAALLKL